MTEGNKAELKHNCENHDQCMEMIQAVLDGSATKEEMDHFRNEMDHCLPCIEGHDLQKSIKEALNVKLEKKCCPEATISKIKASVGLAAVAIGFVILEIKLFHMVF